MQTKVVFMIVLGTAAAGLGAAALVMNGSRETPVTPDEVGSSPATTPAANPLSMSSNDFMYAEDRGAEANPGQEFDWQSRLEQFDWGEIQRLSPEERRARMRELRAEMEARMDTNGDGVVDDDERLDAVLATPWGNRLLERFDANGDGLLDESERQAMREEEARRQAEREARMIERYDQDGDGVLSDQERRDMEREQRRQQEERARRMTEQFDSNGDGELDADERANAVQTSRERREIDAFVRRYDTNGDGQITTVDFNAFLASYQSGERRADVNGDGAVDALDVSAFRDMMVRASNRP